MEHSPDTTTLAAENANGIGALILGIVLISITYLVVYVEVFINLNPCRFIAMLKSSPSIDTLLSIIGEWAGMNFLTFIAIVLAIRHRRSGKTSLSQFVIWYGLSALVVSAIF